MHFDIDGDFFGFGVSPLKPVIIAIFITVFGGVGIIGVNADMSHWASACIGFFVAFICSFLIYRFIIIPLYKIQNKGAVEQKTLVGQIGRVTLGMKEQKFGKISYVVNDNTYTAPAKSYNEEEIAKGNEVVIVDVKNNVFYVAKI
jgi:membrane protein implicated in regulation of membrane protease activity